METMPIIPRPLQMNVLSGTFTLTPATEILVSAETAAIGAALAQRLRPATGLPLPVRQIEAMTPPAHGIALQLLSEKTALGAEGYELTVSDDRIVVTAATPAGLFYACQTLRQLLPAAIESKTFVAGQAWTLPQLEVTDQPRFPWRGMHLDVCRHFMPTAFIKKFIDVLAAYKMNIFHWHLTEDQGWRIEIERYPRLTEIGAWRTAAGQRDGGYYTQAEIRDVVDYARQRFVTVVPEIERPGHAVAALAAYPELSCTGGPFAVATTWGIFDDVYCAGNERTFEFLEHVLAEVIELFPGPYIHIGGDECPKTRWRACPKCQARLAAEGLRDEHELQSYFIKRMERFLNAHQKRLIGWDEILEGGLPPAAMVTSWRGMAGGLAAAQQGHDVIMSPQAHCYFDYYQSANRAQEPQAFDAVLPLERVYAFEPIPAELADAQRQHILGAQGNLWTEYIPTPAQVEYMLLPRFCALAEVVWSARQLRDETDFLTRLSAHYPRFEAAGVNYRRPN